MASYDPLAAIMERLRERARVRMAARKEATVVKSPKPAKPVGKSRRRPRRNSSLH